MKTAKKLPAADATKASNLNAGDWIDAGIQNAKTAVHLSPIGLGAGPFTMSSKYEKAAKALAKKEVALAGTRLANLLNSELK